MRSKCCRTTRCTWELIFERCIAPQANAIGRSSKTVREFLEKNWAAEMSQDESIKLAVKSLLEVVQTGAKNIDLAVMDGFGKVRVSPAAFSLSLVQATTDELIQRSFCRTSPLKRLRLSSARLRRRRRPKRRRRRLVSQLRKLLVRPCWELLVPTLLQRHEWGYDG